MELPNTPAPKKGRGCLIFVVLAAIAGFLLIAGIIIIAIVVPSYVKYKESVKKGIAVSSTESSSKTTPSGETSPTPERLEPEAALRLLFPNDKLSNGKIHRQGALPDDGAEEELPPEERVGELLTFVDSVVPFKEAAQDKLFVIYGSVPAKNALDDNEDSFPHVTSPLLGAAILVPQNGDWQIAVRADDLGDCGVGYGTLPSGRLAELAPDRYGYLLDAGWEGQGYKLSQATIIGQNSKGEIVRLGDIPLARSNTDAGLSPEETYAFDSDITFDFDHPENGTYPILLSRTGTCRDPDGNIHPVSADVVYVLENDGYAPKLGSDPLNAQCDGTL